MDFAMLEGEGKSMLVSGATFQADARGLELVLFLAFILLLAWGVSSLFTMGIQVMVENSGRARKFRDAIERRAAFIPKFKRRRDFLLQVVDQRNEASNSLQTQRANLRKKHNKILAARDQLVRQIGENTVGTNCYNFLVANRYVLSYVAKGQQHPLLDESWKNGQLVEVWARSLMEARIAVVERFPATFGFFVEKLGLKDRDEDPEGGAGPGSGKARVMAQMADDSA
ncbi:MAG: hypothetical protein WCO00_02935 [Rhodospirillaceae bacterium]